MEEAAKPQVLETFSGDVVTSAISSERFQEKYALPLRKKLNALRISQRVLARFWGISLSTLGKLLNGRQAHISEGHLAFLGDFLKGVYDVQITQAAFRYASEKFSPPVAMNEEIFPGAVDVLMQAESRGLSERYLQELSHIVDHSIQNLLHCALENSALHRS